MHHRSESQPSSGDGATRRRWWRRVFAQPGAGSRPPTTGTHRSHSVVGDARVDHVLDPDGSVLLLRVSGIASSRTIDEIARRTTALDHRHTVHLDLHDATIPSVRAVVELEQLADRLERAMVRVRMVGLDPNHPALDAPR